MKISDAFSRFDRGPWQPSRADLPFNEATTERIAWEMERYDRSYGSPDELLRKRLGPYSCRSCKFEEAEAGVTAMYHYHVCPNIAALRYLTRDDIDNSWARADDAWDRRHDEMSHFTGRVV